MFMAPPPQPSYQGYYQASGFMLQAQPPMPYMIPPPMHQQPPFFMPDPNQLLQQPMAPMPIPQPSQQYFNGPAQIVTNY